MLCWAQYFIVIAGYDPQSRRERHKCVVSSVIFLLSAPGFRLRGRNDKLDIYTKLSATANSSGLFMPIASAGAKGKVLIFKFCLKADFTKSVK